MASVVVIGSSTGGPKVLREMFTGMPKLGVAVLLVQHMPHYINERLRATLDRLTAMEVVLGEDGMSIAPGRFIIAPSDSHMTIKDNREIRLTAAPAVNHVCPSIDVLMHSFAPTPAIRLKGIILTGMGSDGASGVVHLKTLGAEVMAQDKKTSAVYGMPRRAIDTGAVDFVGSPEAIASRIRQTCGVGRRRLETA